MTTPPSMTARREGDQQQQHQQPQEKQEEMERNDFMEKLRKYHENKGVSQHLCTCLYGHCYCMIMLPCCLIFIEDVCEICTHSQALR